MYVANGKGNNFSPFSFAVRAAVKFVAGPNCNRERGGKGRGDASHLIYVPAYAGARETTAPLRTPGKKRCFGRPHSLTHFRRKWSKHCGNIGKKIVGTSYPQNTLPFVESHFGLLLGTVRVPPVPLHEGGGRLRSRRRRRRDVGGGGGARSGPADADAKSRRRRNPETDREIRGSRRWRCPDLRRS